MGKRQFQSGCTSAFWVLLLAMGLLGCQPYENKNGDLTVALDGNQFIALDAKAVSCKSLSSATGTPTEDVQALHINLGKMTINWVPPNDAARLKVIYIKMNINSGGLKTATTPLTIASQDLTCLMQGSVDAVAGTTIFAPTQTTFKFASDILVGGLKSADATNRSNFSGSINMIVYAVLQIPGQQDTPLVGRSSARFKFDGIF